MINLIDTLKIPEQKQDDFHKNERVDSDSGKFSDALARVSEKNKKPKESNSDDFDNKNDFDEVCELSTAIIDVTNTDDSDATINEAFAYILNYIQCLNLSENVKDTTPIKMDIGLESNLESGMSQLEGCHDDTYMQDNAYMQDDIFSGNTLESTTHENVFDVESLSNLGSAQKTTISDFESIFNSHNNLKATNFNSPYSENLSIGEPDMDSIDLALDESVDMDKLATNILTKLNGEEGSTVNKGTIMDILNALSKNSNTLNDDKKEDMSINGSNLNVEVTTESVSNTTVTQNTTSPKQIHPIAQQILQSIESKLSLDSLADSTVKIRLKLFPVKLGGVSIDIEHSLDGLRIKMTAENNGVAKILEQSLRELEDVISKTAQGAVNIDVSSDSSNSGKNDRPASSEDGSSDSKVSRDSEHVSFVREVNNIDLVSKILDIKL